MHRSTLVFSVFALCALALVVLSRQGVSPHPSVVQAASVESVAMLPPPPITTGQDPINAFLNCVAGCDATRDAALTDAADARDAARQAAHDEHDQEAQDAHDDYMQDLANCMDPFGNASIACTILARDEYRDRIDANDDELQTALAAANTSYRVATQAAWDAWDACVQACLDTLADDIVGP